MTLGPWDRVRHMLEFARIATSIADDTPPEEFVDLSIPFLAQCRVVELIGEAASQTTLAVRARILDVPWRRVIDMRNRLAHGYADIDAPILLEVVRDHLPPLIIALERALQDNAS